METKEDLVKRRARLVNCERRICKLNTTRKALAGKLDQLDRQLSQLRGPFPDQRERQRIIANRISASEQIRNIKNDISKIHIDKEELKLSLLGTSEDPRTTTPSGAERAHRVENYKAAESLVELRGLLLEADKLLWGEISKGVVFREGEKSVIQNIHQRCMTLRREEMA
jgi:hypothetical protein